MNRSTRPGGMSRGIGFAFATVGAIAFGAKAIIVKLAYGHAVDALGLLALRMVIAFPLFAAMAWWGGRGRTPLTGRQRAQVIGLGAVGYYLSSFLDFAGLQYVSASLERLILHLSPTMVLLLGRLLHGRRWHRLHVLGLAIAYVGVVIAFWGEFDGGGAAVAWGTSLVLASAFCYALYLVQSGELVAQIGAMRLVGAATSAACVFALVHFACVRTPAALLDVPPEVLRLSLLNATLGMAVPVLLVMLAIERIGAATTSLVGLCSPLATMALAMFFLDETIGLLDAAGGALVILGVAVFTRARAPTA